MSQRRPEPRSDGSLEEAGMKGGRLWGGLRGCARVPIKVAGFRLQGGEVERVVGGGQARRFGPEHLSHSLGAVNAIDELSRAGSPALWGLLFGLLGISGPKPPGLLDSCQSDRRETAKKKKTRPAN